MDPSMLGMMAGGDTSMMGNMMTPMGGMNPMAGGCMMPQMGMMPTGSMGQMAGVAPAGSVAPMGGMGAMCGMGCMGGMTPMGGPGMMTPAAAAGAPTAGGVPMASSGGACSSGATGGADDSAPAGAELVLKTVKDLPGHITSDPRGFMLRCAVPGKIAAALTSGGADSATEEVQQFTATRVSIGGNPDDDMRIMNIEGPLLNVCAAYTLMMVRYCEVEQDQAAAGNTPGAVGYTGTSSAEANSGGTMPGGVGAACMGAQNGHGTMAMPAGGPMMPMCPGQVMPHMTPMMPQMMMGGGCMATPGMHGMGQAGMMGGCMG